MNTYYRLTKQTLYYFALIITVTLVGCNGQSDAPSDNVIQDIDSNSEASVVNVTEVLPTNVSTDETTLISEDVDEVSVDVVTYFPDTTKLITEAEVSQDLYVESTFNFDSYKVITIEINATDDSGDALKGTMLTISAIDNNITELDDQGLQDKSLVIKSFTDDFGSININLEVPVNMSNLLLELNTLGIENEVIYALNDTNKVVYYFD